MTSKFATFLQRKKTVPSAPGTKIYKWTYINSQGELVEEERDVDAMIQSFAQSVNYKEAIERYGLDSEFFGGSGNAIYADVTEYDQMDYADVNGYISNLIKELNNALAVKNEKEARVLNEESAEVTEESAKVNKETSETGGKEE